MNPSSSKPPSALKCLDRSSEIKWFKCDNLDINNAFTTLKNLKIQFPKKKQI